MAHMLSAMLQGAESLLGVQVTLLQVAKRMEHQLNLR